MWTTLRIAGGVLFVAALFVRPLHFHGTPSAFQLAAYEHNATAIGIFLASIAFGVTAAISTFFTKRVIEWLEMTLTVAGVLGILGFLWYFRAADNDGVALSWSGLMLVGGLALAAIGANGRYRHARSD
jgi:uncharacterized membrane protein YGL010W